MRRRLLPARLMWEVAWAHLLVRIATFRRPVELRPETYLYLADVHFRLAAEYQSRRQWVKAKRHRIIANRYALGGPPPNPRPAAALAMPIPREPIFTDVRARFAQFLPDRREVRDESHQN